FISEELESLVHGTYPRSRALPGNARVARLCLASPSKVNPLHAMVLGVNYMKLAVAVHRQRPRLMEFSRLAAGAAPATQRLTMDRELLHAIVAALDDVHLAV